MDNDLYIEKTKIEQSEARKPGGKFICSAQLSCTFATSGSRHITAVKYPVVNHEIDKDGIVITTNGNIACSCIKIEQYDAHSVSPEG